MSNACQVSVELVSKECHVQPSNKQRNTLRLYN